MVIAIVATEVTLAVSTSIGIEKRGGGREGVWIEMMIWVVTSFEIDNGEAWTRRLRNHREDFRLRHLRIPDRLRILKQRLILLDHLLLLFPNHLLRTRPHRRRGVGNHRAPPMRL